MVFLLLVVDDKIHLELLLSLFPAYLSFSEQTGSLFSGGRVKLNIDYEIDLEIEASFKHVTRNCCYHMVIVKADEQVGFDGRTKVQICYAG